MLYIACPAQSRRPSSWREENITRTKDEAKKILEGYLKQIQDGTADFGETTFFAHELLIT